MITKEDARKLKKMIGFPHVARVIIYMHEKGMKTRDGADYYSRPYVSQVFNGYVENLKIEHVIWELAEINSKDHNEHLERRETLLKEWLENERKEKARMQNDASSNKDQE